MTITSCAISLLVLWALVALTPSAETEEGTKMDEKVRQRIAEAAAAENGWKIDEVRVDEVEQLRRPACSFYAARHNVLPLSYVRNFALLGGEQVVGVGDAKLVGKILDTCAGDASADWWAEIVTRFHPDLGGGIVLHDENTRMDIPRKLQQAGKTFARPTLDQGKQSLSYLLLNPETRVVYLIQAKRSAGSAIEIVKTRVL